MFVPSVGIPLWTALLIALFALGAGVLFYQREHNTGTLGEKDKRRSPVYVFAVVGLVAFFLLILANSVARQDARDEAQASLERERGITIINMAGMFPIDEDQTVPVIVESGGRLYDGLITTRGGRYDIKLVNTDYYPYPYPYRVMEDTGVYEGDSSSPKEGYAPEDLEGYAPQEDSVQPREDSGTPFEDGAEGSTPSSSDEPTFWGE